MPSGEASGGGGGLGACRGLLKGRRWRRARRRGRGPNARGRAAPRWTRSGRERRGPGTALSTRGWNPTSSRRFGAEYDSGLHRRSGRRPPPTWPCAAPPLPRDVGPGTRAPGRAPTVELRAASSAPWCPPPSPSPSSPLPSSSCTETLLPLICFALYLRPGHVRDVETLVGVGRSRR